MTINKTLGFSSDTKLDFSSGMPNTLWLKKIAVSDSGRPTNEIVVSVAGAINAQCTLVSVNGKPINAQTTPVNLKTFHAPGGDSTRIPIAEKTIANAMFSPIIMMCAGQSSSVNVSNKATSFTSVADIITFRG